MIALYKTSHKYPNDTTSVWDSRAIETTNWDQNEIERGGWEVIAVQGNVIYLRKPFQQIKGS